MTITNKKQHNFVKNSNWISMFCQPHRVTSVQSNSVTSKHTLQNPSHIYIYTNLSKVSLQNQSLHKHKTYLHKHQTQIFEALVPSILSLLKEHIRLGLAGIVDRSI